ncbi:MAG: ATP-dependent Clp protease proteolytic subunit [Acidimicrobiales bacterium]
MSGPHVPGPGGWPVEDPAEDLRARLFDQRVVFVSGPLDQAGANRAAMEIMTLDASGDDPINLQIDSPGGELEAAVALMDVIELAGVPVRVSAFGAVGGPAVGVVALGPRRMASAHTRFHLHEPDGAFEGHVRDVEAFAEHRRVQWATFCERVAAAAGRPAAAVAGDFGRGRFLSAQEALEYGLLDELCRPEARLYRLPGPTMGFGAQR